MSIKQTEGQVAQQGGLSQGVTRSHPSMTKRRRELTDGDATDVAAIKLDDFAARMDRMVSAFEDDPFADLDTPETPAQVGDARVDDVMSEDLRSEADDQAEEGGVLIGGLGDMAEAPGMTDEEDLDLSAMDEIPEDDDDEDMADDAPLDVALDFEAAEQAVDDITFDEEDEAIDDAFEEDASIEEDDLDVDMDDTPVEETSAILPEETVLAGEDDTSVATQDASMSDAILNDDLDADDDAVDERGNISLSEEAIADLLGVDEDEEEALAESGPVEPELLDEDTVEEDATIDESLEKIMSVEDDAEPVAFESVDEELAERNAQISEEILEAQAVAEIADAENELDEAHLDEEGVDQSWGMIEEDHPLPLDAIHEDPVEKAEDPFADVFGKPKADRFDTEHEDVDIGAKMVPSTDAPADNPEDFQAEAVADEEPPVMMESLTENEVDDDMGQSALEKMLQARNSRRAEEDYVAEGDAIVPEVHDEAGFPEARGAATFEADEPGFDEDEDDLEEAAVKSPARGKLMRTVGIGAAALVVAGGVLVGAMSLTGGSSTPPSPVMPGINTVPTGKSNIASAPQAPAAPTDAKTKVADAAPAAPKAATGNASDLAAQIPLPDKSSFAQPQGGGMDDVLAGLKQAGSGDLSDVTGTPAGGDYQAAIQKALVDYASAKDLAGLKDEMAAMKSSIATMNAALSKKDSQIASLQQQVVDAKTEAENAKKLSLAQNDVMVKVVRMGEKVDTGEKLIVDLSKRVAKLESVDPADKAEVKKRLDDLAQRLDGLNRDVALVARVAINGSTEDQTAGAAGATGANADPTSVYASTKPAAKPPVDHGKVPSDVKKGDFVKGYGTVLDILPTSGGSRLVVMENGSVLIK